MRLWCRKLCVINVLMSGGVSSVWCVVVVLLWSYAFCVGCCVVQPCHAGRYELRVLPRGGEASPGTPDLLG